MDDDNTVKKSYETETSKLWMMHVLRMFDLDY